LLQPVHQGGREGLLVIRRNIEPALGKLALPGGYVEDGEDWRQATCREAQEEAGLKVDPARLVIFEALSNPEGNRVLLFALAPAIEGAQLGNFEPTPETSERCVLFSPEELAFPLHTQVASRYLRDIRLTRRI
jgi:ADP-ribose pyrophosphatase YjhB (NUDIX family)